MRQRTCDCSCADKCPQGKAGSAVRCTINVKEKIMKYEIGSQWKTRGGWRAMVLANDTVGVNDREEYLRVWHSDLSDTIRLQYADNGKNGHGETNNYDLIEPWSEPVVHEGWVNIYPPRSSDNVFDCGMIGTRKRCDAISKDRIACVKIKFTEGEGL